MSIVIFVANFKSPLLQKKKVIHTNTAKTQDKVGFFFLIPNTRSCDFGGDVR